MLKFILVFLLAFTYSKKLSVKQAASTGFFYGNLQYHLKETNDVISDGPGEKIEWHRGDKMWGMKLEKNHYFRSMEFFGKSKRSMQETKIPIKKVLSLWRTPESIEILRCLHYTMIKSL